MTGLVFLSLAYWVHDLDPIVFRFSDTIAIRWYGLAYGLGFTIAAILLHLYYKKGRSPFNADQQTTATTVIILGVIVGGRLGYMLFYDLQTFIFDPPSLFRVWEGGMASHGGFIGCILATVWFSRKTNVPLFKTADIIATLAPPGFFVGRIANFVNGELWGKASQVPWAVIFPNSPEPVVPRHPSQLYEAVLEGAVLCLYTQLRFWLGKPGKLPAGQLAGEFLVLYALLRIGGEIFREPDASLIMGMNRGIFYSLFLLAGGIILIGVARNRARTSAG